MITYDQTNHIPEEFNFLSNASGCGTKDSEILENLGPGMILY